MPASSVRPLSYRPVQVVALVSYVLAYFPGALLLRFDPVRLIHKWPQEVHKLCVLVLNSLCEAQGASYLDNTIWTYLSLSFHFAIVNVITNENNLTRSKRTRMTREGQRYLVSAGS